jgi:hypothetical protein
MRTWMKAIRSLVMDHKDSIYSTLFATFVGAGYLVIMVLGSLAAAGVTALQLLLDAHEKGVTVILLPDSQLKNLGIQVAILAACINFGLFGLISIYRFLVEKYEQRTEE